jgi:hypothetical protein
LELDSSVPELRRPRRFSAAIVSVDGLTAELPRMHPTTPLLQRTS